MKFTTFSKVYNREISLIGRAPILQIGGGCSNQPFPNINLPCNLILKKNFNFLKNFFPLIAIEAT